MIRYRCLAIWKGWAMEVAAVDQLSGEPTRDWRTDEQPKLLERLALYGNNAWGDSLSKTVVPRLLRELRDSGLEQTVVVGSLVAKGASERGIKQIEKYNAKM